MYFLKRNSKIKPEKRAWAYREPSKKQVFLFPKFLKYFKFWHMLAQNNYLLCTTSSKKNPEGNSGSYFHTSSTESDSSQSYIDVNHGLRN